MVESDVDHAYSFDAYSVMLTAATFLLAQLDNSNNNYPRDAILARYLLSMCVLPSISPSQAGIVSKWLNVESHKQRRTIAQGLLVLSCEISTKFQLDQSQRWQAGWRKLRFLTIGEVSSSGALLPRNCVHLSRWCMSTTVHWQRNTWCHQHLWW